MVEYSVDQIHFLGDAAVARDITETYMPYAPAQPVLAVIRRMREGRLPELLPVTALPQLGVAEGNADRVHKALRFLDLLDEDGRRTPTFDRLGRVSTDEYPGTLSEIVQGAYAPILTIVNPADSTDVAQFDAFRRYEPSGQRSRMVALFQALCREAGLIPGGPLPARARQVPAPRDRRGGSPAGNYSPRNKATGKATLPADEGSTLPPMSDQADYGILASLIQQLPSSATWTQAKRDRWLKAMTANLDLLVTVDEEVAS